MTRAQDSGLEQAAYDKSQEAWRGKRNGKLGESREEGLGRRENKAVCVWG